MKSRRSSEISGPAYDVIEIVGRLLESRNTPRIAAIVFLISLQFLFAKRTLVLNEVVSHQARKLETTCKALIDRQPDIPRDLKDAVSIKEISFNALRMGKSHIVVFKGGLITVLKLGNSWGSASADSQKVDTRSPGYGVLHKNGISTMSKYKCSFWVDKTTGRTSKQYGEHGENLLNEFFVYHVDRVLGFRTVPEGRLVVISPSVWQKHFATALCVTPYGMNTYMKELTKKHGDLRLVGWLQYFVEVESHYSLNFNGTSLADNKCGFLEANTSTPVVYNRLDPDAVWKYYKYALVVKISRRGDIAHNCFFARHLKNPVLGCKDDITPFNAPVNVDNDRLKPSPSWIYPCLVPKRLQDHILSFPNFTQSVLDSIADHGRDVLGQDDMKYIEGLLRKSQTVFTELQHQFQACHKVALDY